MRRGTYVPDGVGGWVIVKGYRRPWWVKLLKALTR